MATDNSINSINRSRRRKFVIFGRIIFILFLLLVGCLIAFHKKLFPSPNQMPAVLKERENALPKRALKPIDETFTKAQDELIAGNHAHAAALFRELLNRPELQRPLKDWIYLNLYLCAILAHDFDLAERYLTQEKQLGLLAPNPESDEADLSDYLVRTVGALDTATPEQAIFASPLIKQYIFNKTQHPNKVEPFTLLLAGIKNWELGAIDEAARLLDLFMRVDPAKVEPWVLKYQPLAKARLHDYWIYCEVVARLRQLGTITGSDPTKKRAVEKADLSATEEALTEVERAQSMLESTGEIDYLFKFAKSAYKTKIEDLTLALAISEKSSLGKSNPLVKEAEAKADKLDKERWQSISAAAYRSIRLYRFAEAAALLNHANLSSPVYKRAKENMLTRAKRLADFKDTLIDDINHSPNGYPRKIQTRHQITFQGGIRYAEESTLGALPIDAPDAPVRDVPWENLTPQSISQIAKYFIRQTKDPAQVEKKKQLASDFAQEFGLQ